MPEVQKAHDSYRNDIQAWEEEDASTGTEEVLEEAGGLWV